MKLDQISAQIAPPQYYDYRHFPLWETLTRMREVETVLTTLCGKHLPLLIRFGLRCYPAM